MDIKNPEQPADDISPRMQWEHRIQERKQSGKSIRQYCAEEGIKEWQYYKWWRKLQPRPQPTKGVVELKTKASLRRMVVEVGGCHIEVESGFDAVMLREIVWALRTA